jgi:hypothetical protein
MTGATHTTKTMPLPPTLTTATRTDWLTIAVARLCQHIAPERIIASKPDALLLAPTLGCDRIATDIRTTNQVSAPLGTP